MKEQRQKKILELIAADVIETQDELVSRLKAAGFRVTQATISRDIKDLRLVKTMSADGVYKYMVAEQKRAADPDVFLRIIRDTVTSIDYAGNLVVVKTLTGSAPAAAEGVDNLDFAGILGTIAGDNTIFIATVSGEVSKNLAVRFKEILNS